MKGCSCPRNVKCWRHIRAEALVESRALRLLLRAHGRYPRVAA